MHDYAVSYSSESKRIGERSKYRQNSPYDGSSLWLLGQGFFEFSFLVDSYHVLWKS